MKDRTIPVKEARLIAEATADCADEALRWKARAQKAEREVDQLVEALEAIVTYAPDVGVDQFHVGLRQARALLSTLTPKDEEG